MNLSELSEVQLGLGCRSKTVSGLCFEMARVLTGEVEGDVVW